MSAAEYRDIVVISGEFVLVNRSFSKTLSPAVTIGRKQLAVAFAMHIHQDDRFRRINISCVRLPRRPVAFDTSIRRRSAPSRDRAIVLQANFILMV